MQIGQDSAAQFVDVACALDTAHPGERDGRFPVQQCGGQTFQIGELLVDNGSGDTGGPGDAVDGQRGVTVGGDDIAGHIEQLIPTLRTAEPAAGHFFSSRSTALAALCTALSMVADQSVAVQSPASTSEGTEVRCGGRNPSVPTTWEKVARGILTT